MNLLYLVLLLKQNLLLTSHPEPDETGQGQVVNLKMKINRIIEKEWISLNICSRTLLKRTLCDQHKMFVVRYRDVRTEGLCNETFWDQKIIKNCVRYNQVWL